MCNKVISGLQSTGTCIWKGAEDTGKKIGTVISDTYEFIGNKIEAIASRFFCKDGVDFIAGIYWGLPYTIATVAMPWQLPEAVVGIMSSNAACVDKYVSEKTHQRMYTGLRNAAIVRLFVHGAALAAGGSLWLLALAISNIFLAAQAHSVATGEYPAQAKPLFT